MENNNKKSFHFDYLLEPKSCPRPRVTKSSHSYMPKDYVEWKRQFIQETALLLAEYKDFKTIDYPVTVQALEIDMCIQVWFEARCTVIIISQFMKQAEIYEHFEGVVDRR